MTNLASGLVISHLGRSIAVEIAGNLYLCQARRNIETIVAGDQVLVTSPALGQARIENVLPRRSLLQRSSNNNKARPLAANIDNIYIVLAAEPVANFLLIDHYLAICENSTINAALIVNKIDLKDTQALADELQIYQSLGYSIQRTSATKNQGIAELKAALTDHTNMLIGQSGVGKSSLTNALIPGQQLKTQAASKITKQGRHTTTATTLYHLPAGGDLIDSPGVALFGLADLAETQLAWGYREFQPLLGQCKFNDCRHAQDKNCAIRLAVANGAISAQRYQRFLSLQKQITAG